jgi:hypothetical protein
MLGNNLSQNLIDLTRHVRRISTHVEVGLLLKEIVDLRGALAQAVLDVDFLGAGAGEGGDDFEGVAEGGFVFLGTYVSMLDGALDNWDLKNLPPIPSRR